MALGSEHQSKDYIPQIYILHFDYFSVCGNKKIIKVRRFHNGCGRGDGTCPKYINYYYYKSRFKFSGPKRLLCVLKYE